MACWWMKLLSTLSSHPHTDILCQAAGKSHWLAHLYFYTEQFLQNGWGCFILHDRRHNSGKSQRWRNTLHMRKISSSFLFPSFLSLGQGLAKQNKLVWKSQQFPSSAFWVLLLKTRLMPARKPRRLTTELLSPVRLFPHHQCSLSSLVLQQKTSCKHTLNPAHISCGSHKPSFPYFPSPNCCCTSDPNSSTHSWAGGPGFY